MGSSPLRPAREDDAAAIAAIFNSTFPEWRPTDDVEILTWLRNDEIGEENVRVLELDGRVAGYGDLWIENGRVELDVAAPGHWDAFLEWAEQRARDDGGSANVRACFPHGHELQAIVAGRGYTYWRSSFAMHIELDRPPEVPSFPEGLVARPFDESESEILRVALNEAFSLDPFFHEVSPANFREFFLRARGYDPALWTLVWDDDELAAFCLAWPVHGADESTGWIGTLGVRPSWRRRGIASALLHNAFALLYDRGLRSVGLGVDAENPTGAVALYERAGMRQRYRLDNYLLAV